MEGVSEHFDQMPKDCNDFAVLTSAQRYRQCLAMRMVQMFKKTLLFFSKLLFLQQKSDNHIKPTLVDSHPFVSANYSGMRLRLIVSPSITGRELMDGQQFLHCFHSLHLHQTGSQRRRGSDTGPWVEDTVHSVMKTGGLINFSEIYDGEIYQWEEADQDELCFVLFYIYSLFSKAHSTCGVSLLDYLHLTLCPMILVAKNSCRSDCSEIYFKIQLGSEEQRTPVGNLGAFGTFGILLELKYLKSHVGKQTFSGRLSKAGIKEQPVTSCAKINQIYTVPCCKAFDYLLNMCWY